MGVGDMQLRPPEKGPHGTVIRAKSRQFFALGDFPH